MNIQEISGQEIQDSLIRKMSADERFAFGIRLWYLGRELNFEKTFYGSNGSTTIIDRYHRNS